MNAILINAEHRRIDLVKCDGIIDMYRLIKCEHFEVAWRFQNGDAIFIDDCGMINQTPYGFKIKNSRYDAFAGNGLVVGSDRHGNERDPKIGLIEIASMIDFCARQKAY